MTTKKFVKAELKRLGLGPFLVEMFEMMEKTGELESIGGPQQFLIQILESVKKTGVQK